jgi:hypothetical protein
MAGSVDQAPISGMDFPEWARAAHPVPGLVAPHAGTT